MLWMMASLALAGEVQVICSNPVAILVDGVMLEWPEGSTMVTASNLDEGTHLVRAATVFGKPIADLEVKVGANERVRLQYQRKQFSELGRAQLVATVAEEPQVEVTSDASVKTQDSVQTSTAGLTIQVDLTGTGAKVAVEGADGEAVTAGAHVHGDVATTSATTTSSHAHDPTRAVATGLSAGPEEQRVVARPMPEPAFNALVNAIDDESFSSDQLEVIHTASVRNHFVIEQVLRLIEPLSFSKDKVSAVEILRPKILDPENAFLLNEAFSFSSDKKKIQALFR